MRTFSFRTSRRVVVAVVAGSLIAASLLAGRANPAPPLPPIAPGRLLASSLEALAAPRSLSGVVAVDGIEAQPRGRNARLTHAVFRLWRSAAGLRIAQVVDFGEDLIVANADEAWLWNFETFSAHRLASDAITSHGFDFSPSIAADPFSFARSVLATFAPYSRLEVSGTTEIAGRPAYVLTMRSEQRNTRLQKIVVGIDASTRLPLLLDLTTSRFPPAAVEIRFTAISFGPVDETLFSFSPPPGATVVEGDVFRGGGGRDGSFLHASRTFGRGWRTVVAWRLSRRPTPGIVNVFPLWHAVGTTTIVRAHGRTWIVGGFVSPARLERVAGRLR